MGRTLRWLPASCQTDHQGSISGSCTRRGSLEVCSSLSRSSSSAFSWFDSIHLLSCLSGRLCKGQQSSRSGYVGVCSRHCSGWSMAKTCRRLLLFQARQTSVLFQSPRFLLSCSVRGMPELVQCLSRPYWKPTCLDRPAHGCTWVCDQPWTHQSRSFFLSHPTSSCHVEFSNSRCLWASEVPWCLYKVTIRSVAILFY